METKQATVMAGLASGRPLHNNAKAKFPPFPQKGVLWGGRPDRGMFPVSGPSHLARSVVADHWRQAGHHTTAHRRSSRLFPRRVFHLAGDPTEGRLCACSCDDEHTIASSPDLCKSGAQIMKKHIFSMNYAQRNKHIGLNGVSPYSTDRALLTEK